MSVYKRGDTYWFSFVRNGRRIQRSTGQANRKVAMDIEATAISEIARGNWGILEQKDAEPVPTVKSFLQDRFLPYCEAAHKEKISTWKFYRHGVRRLCEYAPLANKPLNAITSETVAGFAAHRQAKHKKVTAINRELQVLRRAFHCAVEWGDVERMPKVRMLKGEISRERVISELEETAYLTAVAEPLKSLATILIDGGWRPEEAFRLDWKNIHWNDRRGPNGSISNLHGKTKAARRTLPMTPRVRAILEDRWNAAGRPTGGFVWPAPTKSGHIEPSTYRKLHTAAFEAIAKQAKENGTEPLAPFILYCLRHSFLTRLGATGVDAWTLARIAGHEKIAMSMRYVHVSDTGTFNAFEKLASAPTTNLRPSTGS